MVHGVINPAKTASHSKSAWPRHLNSPRMAIKAPPPSTGPPIDAHRLNEWACGLGSASLPAKNELALEPPPLPPDEPPLPSVPLLPAPRACAATFLAASSLRSSSVSVSFAFHTLDCR